jgi:hypothetical protein
MTLGSINKAPIDTKPYFPRLKGAFRNAITLNHGTNPAYVREKCFSDTPDDAVQLGDDSGR